jgi:sugar lactone lactonase YvrE
MALEARSPGQRQPLVAGVLTTVLLLSGCGGGGGSIVTSSFTVGGSVSGLQSGESVILENNGGNPTTVNASGTFTFADAVASGSGYSVTVTTQPAGQTCSVSEGSGTVGSANITTVSVSCASNPAALAMIAGTGTGPGNTDGTLTTARFNNPFGVAIDASGNTYVVDADSDTVRRITAAGAVSTFAGTPGQPGSADGMGAAARFRSPRGIAVDGAGNVYVSDTGNDTIREITPAGSVTTLAGTAGIAGMADGTGAAAQFSGPQGIATDSSGNIYVADSFNNRIREIAPGSVVTTLAGQTACGSTDGVVSTAQFCRPFGLATDGTANVYVADSGNDTIRRISAGQVTTVAGTPGLVGSADGTGGSATFSLPSGLAVDASGNIYVADTGNATVRAITTGGGVTTLAGTASVLGYADGTGPAAQFRGGQGPAVDSHGNVYLADNSNLTIRKITPQGVVSTFAGAAPELGNADGTGHAARFYGPNGLATDSSGNVFIADTFNCEIRKMTPTGTVTTLAGSPNQCAYPQFGNADGTGAAAQFAWPNGVAVDSSGNVYVADTQNETIRKITPAGVVTTFAGTTSDFNSPSGLITDSAGNVYVADTGNDTIRKITPAGMVTTLAGAALSPGSADGDGAAARFSAPLAITIDSGGNLFVSDSNNNTIREITPAGAVTTLAGTAGVTGSADGTGSGAQFNDPAGITIDASGNLYVVDAGNYTIRKITPGGVVTTVVGVAGQTGFTTGALPGVLDAQTEGVAISGSSLYISTYAGIAVITNLP